MAWKGGNIAPICWQLAPHCVPCANIHLPPIDPVFDIYQSAGGSLTQSQLLLLFVQLSREEQTPRDLGSQFIILMTAAFAGTQKFRGQMGMREARCQDYSPIDKPSRPWLDLSLSQEEAEAGPGERQVTITQWSF